MTMNEENNYKPKFLVTSNLRVASCLNVKVLNEQVIFLVVN